MKPKCGAWVGVFFAIACGEEHVSLHNAQLVSQTSVCGNGVVESAEACDDGNTREGDACSWACDRLTVRGVITTDATWDDTRSPYWLIGDVTIAEDVTLTIAKGVTVMADGHAIQVYGTLHVAGTAGARVRLFGLYLHQGQLEDLGLEPPPSVVSMHFTDVFNTGETFALEDVTLSLADCGFFGVSNARFWSIGESYIVRSVFGEATALVLGGREGTLLIENDLFPASDPSAYPATLAAGWAPLDLRGINESLTTTVRNNTFLASPSVLLPGKWVLHGEAWVYEAVAFDVSDNYWGTSDLEKINATRVVPSGAVDAARAEPHAGAPTSAEPPL